MKLEIPTLMLQQDKKLECLSEIEEKVSADIENKDGRIIVISGIDEIEDTLRIVRKYQKY